MKVSFHEKHCREKNLALLMTLRGKKSGLKLLYRIVYQGHEESAGSLSGREKKEKRKEAHVEVEPVFMQVFSPMLNKMINVLKSFKVIKDLHYAKLT